MEKELEEQGPVPAVSLLLSESSVEYNEWVDRELGNQRKRDGGQDCVTYSVDFVDFADTFSK